MLRDGVLLGCVAPADALSEDDLFTVDTRAACCDSSPFFGLGVEVPSISATEFHIPPRRPLRTGCFLARRSCTPESGSSVAVESVASLSRSLSVCENEVPKGGDLRRHGGEGDRLGTQRLGCAFIVMNGRSLGGGGCRSHDIYLLPKRVALFDSVPAVPIRFSLRRDL